MELIQQFFKGIQIPVVEKLSTIITQKKLKKGEYLLKEGQVSTQIAFVLEGALQTFFSKEGEEITTYLAGPGKMAVSLSSFLNALPSKENIKALTETIVMIIEKVHIEKLINENEDFKQFYIETLEHQITCIDESRFDLITLTSLERYSKLLSEELSVLQQFPSKYLAATLGITERQMSRIRKKILKI
jgi:CRP-like cAMP-binding protein